MLAQGNTRQNRLELTLLPVVMRSLFVHHKDAAPSEMCS